MPDTTYLSPEQINELAREHTQFNGSHAMTNYVSLAHAVIAAHDQARAAAVPDEVARLRQETQQLAQRWADISPPAEPQTQVQSLLQR